MTRPPVSQLLFAATAIAAVIVMPADALTASSSAPPTVPSNIQATPATVPATVPATDITDIRDRSAATAPVGSAAPSTDEQITRAVRTSPLLGEVPPDGIQVVDVHVSRIDPTVAVAHVVPASGETDPATALLRHSGSHWAVVELGTAGVGCDSLSTAVQQELGLVCELL
ncbi:hypothetical protein [Frankia sp. CiP3]|uniref:hypothetical protein n=1 Tax=Frankia sp. CiP3 TaxID=2880971 RepID=UPI001EF6A51D|nr:hypothetical protein [Frankia sp. CiP3]